MKIQLLTVAGRTSSGLFDPMAQHYAGRIQAFAEFESVRHKSETALLEAVERNRNPGPLVLLDSRGKLFSSRDFAAWIGGQRDTGRRNLIFAIGPADGWSDEARKRAELLLSLGPMTLAHELARVVLCEQIYRAFTILAGHPYHTGH